MKLKRNKYSLRNCNPPERMIRRKINELDFKMKLPFYDFDKDRIDISLLRRFLYQNKIPAYYLYTEEMIENQLKEKKSLSEKQRKYVAEDDIGIENRFDILDL